MTIRQCSNENKFDQYFKFQDIVYLVLKMNHSQIKGTPFLVITFHKPFFKILISETVEQRIQHRDHHGVKHRSQLILSQGVAGSRSQISVDGGGINQNVISQVRGSCEEFFALFLP